MNNYLSIGVDALVTFNFHKVLPSSSQIKVIDNFFQYFKDAFASTLIWIQKPYK
jgi:hypothetical protein